MISYKFITLTYISLQLFFYAHCLGILVHLFIIQRHYIALEIANCVSDIDECLADPCLHNGNCTNTDGSYTCSCVPQWTGYNCQNGKALASFLLFPLHESA